MSELSSDIFALPAERKQTIGGRGMTVLPGAVAGLALALVLPLEAFAACPGKDPEVRRQPPAAETKVLMCARPPRQYPGDADEAARKPLPSAEERKRIEVERRKKSEAHAREDARKYGTTYRAAQKAESANDDDAAVRIYKRLAAKSNGKAARRLGDIYDKGTASISRNYAESLQWYERARNLGESIEVSGKR